VVRTCLWYDDNALEAAEFYVSLLPNSSIDSIVRTPPDGPVVVVEFTLDGTPYMGLNGGPRHKLSEAVSISVPTPDQAETDRLWEALSADGGEEIQCGWVRDRFGLYWQIVPEIMPRALASDDREAASRAFQAMLTMTKLDAAALEAAFKGENA